MINPADLDIAEASAALRSGELSAVELTQACLDRIKERDSKIGAFVFLAEEAALQAARAADAALAAGQEPGPLHGIPFAIKDVFDVAGWPVRFGCAHFDGRIAQDTAEAVANCIAAGAVPLGLVATYELATVGPDATSLYPQPRNPWNLDHVTGGSSSGAAAAVASGMVRFALGSDTGGSARSPAAYCGVVGFKPTVGRIGKGGLMPLAPSMDEVGILAGSAEDAALVFAVLAGEPLKVNGRKAEIAYGRDWCVEEAKDTALLTLMDEAASALSLTGAEIALVEMPDYLPIERAGSAILLSEQIQSHWDDVGGDPTHVGNMAYASLKSGHDISEKDLSAAQKARIQFAAELDAILATQDALILPTTMTTAPPFSDFESGDPVWTAMRTIPFNLSGHPALTVPIGFHKGMPLGMQIVGAKGRDALVLQIGAAFEAATDHGAMRPYRA